MRRRWAPRVPTSGTGPSRVTYGVRGGPSHQNLVCSSVRSLDARVADTPSASALTPTRVTKVITFVHTHESMAHTRVHTHAHADTRKQSHDFHVHTMARTRMHTRAYTHEENHNFHTYKWHTRVQTHVYTYEQSHNFRTYTQHTHARTRTNKGKTFACTNQWHRHENTNKTHTRVHKSWHAHTRT